MRPGLRSRRSFLECLGAAAVGLTISDVAGAATAEEPKLNFFNWESYIGESTLDDFEKASGITVSASLFSTNEDMFAKLQSGNSGFDVIVPGGDFVGRMADAGTLMPLDHLKIPNFRNLAPDFADVPFDPKRVYSMPYTWLVAGIGYRKSSVKQKPDSWKWLLDSDVYKGRIAVSSDASELFRHVFKYMGESANANSAELTRKAEALLIRQKPNIKAFHEDNGQDLLLSGEVDLVMEYNGDIAQVMSEDADIDFVVPREGAIRQSDNLAVPKDAPHPDNAHKFINYVLGAQAGAAIYKTLKYPSPNAAATALMPDDYRNSAVLFPPADVMAKCEDLKYPGSEALQLLDDALARLRAS